MQGQDKIPKFDSKIPLLPHFTDTVIRTTIYSIQVYCLDVIHDCLNLWRLLFFCISLIKCIISLPCLLTFQAFIISHFNFYSLCCGMIKFNCIQSNRLINSQSDNAQPFSLVFQMFKQVYQCLLCLSTSKIFLLNTQRTTSLTFLMLFLNFFSCYGFYIYVVQCLQSQTEYMIRAFSDNFIYYTTFYLFTIAICYLPFHTRIVSYSFHS